MNIAFKKIINSKYYKNRKVLFYMSFLAVISFVTLISIPKSQNTKFLKYSDQMIKASETMSGTIDIIRDFHVGSGKEIDIILDPNKTGLIGPELSELVTTVGDLEAKRTTTIPDMAALLVHLLAESGVSNGDKVAIGGSASFPACLIASVIAVEALEAVPVAIISLGSSSFGASGIDFNILDIYHLLLSEGMINYVPAGISLGGENDTGEDFSEETKNRLLKQINDTRNNLIFEPDLRKNVEIRMELFTRTAGLEKIAAFINVGGSFANIGTSSKILSLNPGLVNEAELPEEKERGVLFEMLSKKIPVIHLLYIKGLTQEYGIPWDPVPLPESGSVGLIDPSGKRSLLFWVVSGVYLLIFCVSVIRIYKITNK
ncbi:poly-gamma-glutamate system protein [candidate division KSB1 bacterium]